MPLLDTSAIAIDSVIKAGTATAADIAEAIAIADYPFLGMPIVKPVWEGVFGFISRYFTLALEKGANFQVMDRQASQEKMALKTALTNLMIAEKKGDPDALQTAISNFENAHAALVVDDGSSPAPNN